jgi:hypothetical protein
MNHNFSCDKDNAMLNFYNFPISIIVPIFFGVFFTFKD